MTDDIRFDRDMQTLLEQLPEEQLPAARVTPWRQAMRCVLWGIGLTSITLNFWNLQHLLPMVGSILLMLGFRTLRQENGCLRSCWRLSIALAVLRGGYAVVMGTVLSRLVPWLEAAIAWTLSILFWLVCLGLWWGMREIGRKAGQEKPSAKAAGALVLWYGVLILTGLLGQTLQGLAVWLLLALYIIILRQLTRLTRALDNCGYAVEAAPVRLDGRWLAGGYLVLVLAAVLLGQALGQRLPMDYRPRQEPSQTAQAVRDRLEGLNLPRELLDDLSKDFMCDYDDAGSIGKRYRRQDEIGTPYCITVDFDTVGDADKEGDHCVTVRDRDTMEQVRLPISELKDYLREKMAF